MINRKEAKNIRFTGRSAFAALSLTLIFLVGALAASAQHGYRITKRVAFKKGAVSATVRGRLPNELEVHEYVFRGRAGQTATIDLSSLREDVTFYITDDEGNHLDEGSELRNWNGELPADGDYHVYVSASTGRPISYSMSVRIATDI